MTAIYFILLSNKYRGCNIRLHPRTKPLSERTTQNTGSHSVPQSPVARRNSAHSTSSKHSSHHQQNQQHHHQNNNLVPPVSSPYMFSSMEEGLEDLESYSYGPRSSRRDQERRGSQDSSQSSGSSTTTTNSTNCPNPPQTQCQHNRNYPCSECLEIRTAAAYIRPHSAHRSSEEAFLHRRSCPPSDKENSFDNFAVPIGLPPRTPARYNRGGDPRQHVQGGSVRRKKPTPLNGGKTPVVPTLSLPVPTITPSRSMDNNLHLVASNMDEFSDIPRYVCVSLLSCYRCHYKMICLFTNHPFWT